GAPADVHANVARLDSVSLYSLDADLDDLGASAGAHLVQPVVAGHYQRSADPQTGQRSRDGVQVSGVRNPDELARRPGRVGEGAEEVEDRTHGQLLAHGHDEARRLVVNRREHEAEADAAEA